LAVLNKSKRLDVEYELHRLIKDALYTNIGTWSSEVKKECQLSNGKIADIWFRFKDDIGVVEVKTVYKVSLIENAFSKYHNQCTLLFVAFPEGEIPASALLSHMHWERPGVWKVGLLEVGNDGISLRRCPERLEMKTTRRSPKLSGSSSR
jgi:hypothetical protein